MKEHAVIVLRDSGGRILFVRRSVKKKVLPGIWAFPSGTIEEGEEIFENVRRGGMEELGLEVLPERIFGEVELGEFSVKLYFVLCSFADGEPRIAEPDEIDEMEWLSFDDFFERFSDDEIGHGLIWLRKNPDLWKKIGTRTNAD